MKLLLCISVLQILPFAKSIFFQKNVTHAACEHPPAAISFFKVPILIPCAIPL